MRAQEFISENIKDQTQASGEKVLAYINSIHPDGLTPRMSQAVLKHPQYQLQRVPLTSLHIPDQDLDDPDQDPLVDPYDRVMVVDPAHADEYSSNFIDRRPIVVDANGFILDGNHRAWAAAELMNRDNILAWVPSDVNENFADGKVKGKSRPGRVKRAGASCSGSVTSLRQKARQGGERGRMYHWCANMKSGKKNK